MSIALVKFESSKKGIFLVTQKGQVICYTILTIKGNICIQVNQGLSYAAYAIILGMLIYRVKWQVRFKLM